MNVHDVEAAIQVCNYKIEVAGIVFSKVGNHLVCTCPARDSGLVGRRTRENDFLLAHCFQAQELVRLCNNKNEVVTEVVRILLEK